MMSEGRALSPNALHDIAENLRQTLGEDIAIVLVGSAARGVWTEASDIDLLLIGNDRPRVAGSFPGYHIQSASEAEFLRGLSAGKDFEAWCVRLGVPLYDGGIWARVKASSASATWPNPKLKVIHGAYRLFMATRLSKTGDESAATEETLYALGHVARGILLKAGIFPLSRPELANQVREAGYPHLADIHERLRKAQNTSVRVLGMAQRYSKKLLCDLDADTYRTCSQEYRHKRRMRDARRLAH